MGITTSGRFRIPLDATQKQWMGRPYYPEKRRGLPHPISTKPFDWMGATCTAEVFWYRRTISPKSIVTMARLAGAQQNERVDMAGINDKGVLWFPAKVFDKGTRGGGYLTYLALWGLVDHYKANPLDSGKPLYRITKTGMMFLDCKYTIPQYCVEALHLAYYYHGPMVSASECFKGEVPKYQRIWQEFLDLT